MIIKLSEQEMRKYIFTRNIPVDVIIVLMMLPMCFRTPLIGILLLAIIFIISGIFNWLGATSAIKLCGSVQAKGQRLSNQIASVRKIVCEGQASSTKKSVGWMVLTEDALEYYELEQHQNGGNIAILIDDITGTSVKGKDPINTIVINTRNETYAFRTYKAQIWKEQVDRTVAG